MTIQPKYDVGYTFWVPRVVYRYGKEEPTVIDGKLWTHKPKYLDSYVKQKRIWSIDISICLMSNKKIETNIKYGILDADCDKANRLFQYYPEGQISNFTKEQAEEYVANWLKKHPNEECYIC